MIIVTPGAPIYLAAGATDMRKQFDGLVAIVDNELELDSLSGALFVFCNRRRDRLKILHWDGSGLCVFAKRLERGTFSWPSSKHRAVQFTDLELRCLLDGIEMRETRQRKWLRKSHRQDDLEKRPA
jgi:transposase